MGRERGDIAREGGGIAGDIDDLGWGHGEQRAGELAIQPAAGRIDGHGVKTAAVFAGEARGVLAEEFHFFAQAVAARGLARVRHGGGMDFHARHMGRAARERQRNRTRAAIGVQHALFARERKQRKRLIV